MRAPRSAQIAPPDLPEGLAPPERPPELGERASFARALWAGLRLDDQIAEDVSLEQIDMRGGSLQRAELPLLQLIDSRLDGVDLAGASLPKAYLRRVELIGCRLIGATISDADLQDVRLVRCSARLLRWWGTGGRGVRFEQCALQEASFERCDLSGAVFARCDLSGADFRGAKLRGADLRGSALGGIRAAAADLAGAIIDPAQAVALMELFGLTVRPEDQA